MKSCFASIDHLVNCLLATRLRSKLEKLPKLSYFNVSQLALLGLSEGAFQDLLKKAAQIRNQVAHEIDPPKTDVFSS